MIIMVHSSPRAGLEVALELIKALEKLFACLRDVFMFLLQVMQVSSGCGRNEGINRSRHRSPPW